MVKYKEFKRIENLLASPIKVEIPNLRELLEGVGWPSPKDFYGQDVKDLCNHSYNATHKTDEHGTLIWECCCGKTVSSM